MKNGEIPAERPWFKVWPVHLPKTLKYPSVPAWWILERNQDRFSHRLAILFINYEDLTEIERLTYGELWQKANALAAGLHELGVKKGDRIATLLPNSPSIIISYYGIWLAGAAITPCNAMAKENELEYQLKDSGTTILIAAEHLGNLAIPLANKVGVKVVLASITESDKFTFSFQKILKNGGIHPDVKIEPEKDMAVLLYTGGTTGIPKGAILTHRNIVANTIQYADWYAFEPGMETCICTIPMSHSGGMSGVMNVPIYAGATLIVMTRFKAEAIAKTIEKYNATRFFSVPTTYIAIMNNDEAKKCDLSSLKACRTNAAPLPVAVKEAFDKMVGKEVLIEGYGLTETSPLTHANPLDRAKPGSIGIPLPDTDCKIVDVETGADLPIGSEGELVLRGPQVMKGYWNKPDETAKAMEGGWFHTGDVAKMDEEGFVYILDRLKDMINSGGYKIWPRDVEEVLYCHPKVHQAAVVGAPDDYYGEIVKAFIVPKVEDISAEEIISFCKKKMSNYKVPKVLEFCNELLISPQGKILKYRLKKGGLKKE